MMKVQTDKLCNASANTDSDGLKAVLTFLSLETMLLQAPPWLTRDSHAVDG